MEWEHIVDYAHHHLGKYSQISEYAGWGTLLMSSVGIISSVGHFFGAITIDGVNQWLIFGGSAITGVISVGTLLYFRVLRARLEGGTLQRIYAANDRAIELGLPVPFPAFLPKGNITIKTETKIEVKQPEAQA